MNTEKRQDLSRCADEKSTQPIDPISSLTALTSVSDTSLGADAPLPSGIGFARQFFRVWTRRLMLVCGLLAVALSVSVPLLSKMAVSEISVEGAAYYQVEVLLATADVSVGDELLAFSPDRIEQKLLTAHPYLATARVTRSMGGRVHIQVTERTAQWALYLSEGSVALVDQSMQVLELTSSQQELCLIKWELFPKTGEEGGENSEGKLPDGGEQTIWPGTPYLGNLAAIEKLTAIHDALQSLRYDEIPVMIDMTDPYAVALYLSDGTKIDLHECRLPTEQMRAALSALQAYRQQYGNNGPLLIDVDDFSRVSLRALPTEPQ